MPIKEKPLKRRNPNNPQIKSYTEAIRRGQKNIHVVYRDEKKWEVKRLGSNRGEGFFLTRNRHLYVPVKLRKEAEQKLLFTVEMA